MSEQLVETTEAEDMTVSIELVEDYNYEYKGWEVRDTVVEALRQRADQFAQRAQQELSRGAANRALIDTMRWGEQQLNELANVFDGMDMYEVRQRPSDLIDWDFMTDEEKEQLVEDMAEENEDLRLQIEELTEEDDDPDSDSPVDGGDTTAGGSGEQEAEEPVDGVPAAGDGPAAVLSDSAVGEVVQPIGESIGDSEVKRGRGRPRKDS